MKVNEILRDLYKDELVYDFKDENLKDYYNEVYKSFGKLFQNKWRKNFKCPVCDNCALDLGVKEKIGCPIVCTNCETRFTLKILKDERDEK